MARRKLGFWRRLAVSLVLPILWYFTKPVWRGRENLPEQGPVILVANHASHFDPLVMAHFVYRGRRWPRFLAKASLWDVPVFGPLLRKWRQIPVERGSVEAVKSLDALLTALRDDGVVIIYPEGTTTKEPDLWPMRGKTGAARLALLSGAPVVPVANWGAYRIFDPRTGKLKLRPRQPVEVIAGPALDLSRWQGAEPTRQALEEITEQMMLTVRSLLTEIRDGEAPPLYAPARGNGRRSAPPEVAG